MMWKKLFYSVIGIFNTQSRCGEGMFHCGLQGGIGYIYSEERFAELEARGWQ